MSTPPPTVEVQARPGDCTGLLADLEKTMRRLPPGGRILTVAPDIPTRIEILAWAGRKGHRVRAEPVDGAATRLFIEKVAPSAGVPATPA